MRNPALRPCEPPEAVVDVPLPHDLVRDLLALGLLSHTLIPLTPALLPPPTPAGSDLHTLPCRLHLLHLYDLPSSAPGGTWMRGSKMHQTTIEDHRNVLFSIPMPALYSRMARRRHNTPHRVDAWTYTCFAAWHARLQPPTPPQKAGGLASVTCSTTAATSML
jgi:hypothetical protein